MVEKLKLKENNNFLTKDNIDFINNVVLNKNFPYFINHYDGGIEKTNLSNTNDILLSHTVQIRLENCHLKDAINSPHYDITLDILKNFCKSINQKVNFFIRINYNLTFNNGKIKPLIHRDHESFDHKQIIIYLNDCDKEATTCIVNNKNKLLKEITPEKYKGICFNNLKHYQKFPKTGHRVVLVATFI
jgi:hypothetical protein